MMKTVSFILSLVIVLSGILTGCGENPAQSEEEAGPHPQRERLQRDPHGTQPALFGSSRRL